MFNFGGGQLPSFGQPQQGGQQQMQPLGQMWQQPQQAQQPSGQLPTMGRNAGVLGQYGQFMQNAQSFMQQPQFQSFMQGHPQFQDFMSRMQSGNSGFGGQIMRPMGA